MYFYIVLEYMYLVHKMTYPKPDLSKSLNPVDLYSTSSSSGLLGWNISSTNCFRRGFRLAMDVIPPPLYTILWKCSLLFNILVKVISLDDF